MQRLRSWLKKTIYLSIACVLLFALGINLVRHITPALNQHTVWFSKIVSKILHSPVHIERVRLGWFQYQPVLTFDDVTVFYLRPNKSQSTLSIRQVRVFFSLFKSVREWQIRTNGVVIEGVKVKAVRRERNRIFVDDIPFSTDFDSSSFQPDFELQELLDWFSQQTGVVVKNAWIRYDDALTKKQYTFFVNELAFLNANEFHYWRGKAMLTGNVPVKIDFAAKWDGELTNLEKFKESLRARVYLNLTGVDLASVVNALPMVFPPDSRAEAVKQFGTIEQGSGVFKIWVNWHLGALRSAQTQMSLRDVAWRSPQRTVHVFPRIEGHLGYKKRGKLMVLAGQDIFIDFPKRFWPATYFYLEMHDYIIDRLHMGYVNASDVLPIALPYLSQEHQRTISDLSLQGSVEQIRLTFDRAHPLMLKQAAARLVDVSFVHRDQAISGLSAALQYQKDALRFDLHSENIRWGDSRLRSQAVMLEKLNGQFQVTEPMTALDCLQNGLKCKRVWSEKKAREPVIEIKNVSVKNPDIQFDGAGSVTFSLDGALPKVDLAGKFNVFQLQNLARYLPLKHMEPELGEWLSRAFWGGKFTRGQFILKGNVADFPFDQPKTDGLFLVEGDASDVNFHFAPDWPNLLHGHARIQFLNKSLHIALQKAELHNIPVKNFRGEIIELLSSEPAIVDVYGNTKTNIAHGLSLLHSSPLEKNIGKKLQELTANGTADLQLALHVPIKFPEKTKVQGELQLQNVTLAFPSWKLNVEHVKGTCYFDESRFYSSVFPLGLRAELWNKPVLFSIETLLAGKPDALLRVWLTMKVAVNDVKKWLQLTDSAVKNIMGETDISAKIDVLLKKKQPMELSLTSDLQGISFSQNNFLNKSIEQKKPSSAWIAFDSVLKARVHYADEMNAAVLMSHQKNKFSLQGLSLSLGKKDAMWPTEAGLFLQATLDQFNDDDLRRYTKMDASASVLPLPLKRVSASIGRVELFGLMLNDVQLRVFPKQNTYRMLLNSRQVNGEISVKSTRSKRWEVDARFAKVQLELSQRPASAHVSDWSMLQQLRFQANRLSYRKMVFDDARFVLSSEKKGFRLKSFVATSDNVKWQSQGLMRANGERFNSHVQGQLNIKNTDLFLRQLDLMSDSLAASQSEMTFSLDWASHLFSPHIPSLSGQMNLNVGSGSILSVEKQSGGAMNFGRLLSLLSVQNLPRHLILDFRDVQTGYVFDSIKGEFNLKHGQAHTKNMVLAGPIANIFVAGRIGLANKDVDVKVYVHPMVSATSLPIAASLIAGHPMIGAAVLVANGITQNFKKPQEKSSYGYSLTGRWNELVWKELK